jgi:hypothetical protein
VRNANGAGEKFDLAREDFPKRRAFLAVKLTDLKVTKPS